ncbi:MAG: CBS domain-containing protein [Treponema sp.]|jgi:PTS system nitrogen regulatory IIA component|nr:CBS domain-containing protein [Treponema sp.]
MKLSSLLIPELVLLKKPGKTKEVLLDELIRSLYRTRQPIPVPEAEVRRAVLDREQLGETVFESGLAIPHARLPQFNDFFIVIGVPEVPVVYEHIPIRMMILMLTSQSGSTVYLNALAAFVKLSQDTELFARLCSVAEPQDFIQILKDRNIEVTKEFLVSSIMRRSVTALHPDNTVKEAVDTFYRHHLSYLPILERNNDLAGELTALDVFTIGIPDYAVKMENLKFLNSIEPFEGLVQKENTMLVREVMKKPSLTLTEDAPVIEAIMKFIRSNRKYLPVVKDGKLTGMVTYMDILHKVLRA